MAYLPDGAILPERETLALGILYECLLVFSILGRHLRHLRGPAAQMAHMDPI